MQRWGIYHLKSGTYLPSCEGWLKRHNNGSPMWAMIYLLGVYFICSRHCFDEFGIYFPIFIFLNAQFSFSVSNRFLNQYHISNINFITTIFLWKKKFACGSIVPKIGVALPLLQRNYKTLNQCLRRLWKLKKHHYKQLQPCHRPRVNSLKHIEDDTKFLVNDHLNLKLPPNSSAHNLNVFKPLNPKEMTIMR